MGLTFDKNSYEVKSITVNGEDLVYRAYEGIPYVESPQSELQVINIYIPEKSPYKEGRMPIFLPNTVGGYMPGKADTPKVWEDGTPNSLVQALLRGYMVAAPGLRGRGMKNEKGENIGVAPADICDYKAAVRYLRYNKEHIPGDTEKIISNGTSAGGAMSALLGTTGNHPDYEPYLDAIGAVKERDDIFYASCYCPIINLEHADAAYEWEFFGLWDCHQGKYIPPEHTGEEGKWVPVVRQMTEEQKKVSEELKNQFALYVKNLGLTDALGVPLVLEEEGGTLRDLLCWYILQSADEAVKQGENLEPYGWLLARGGEIVAMDYQMYIKYRTRMKDTPAFDKFNLTTPENELFGNTVHERRHFTEYSHKHSCSNGEMAEPLQIKMMNPMEYVSDERAVKAQHIRIRHGAIDRDTSVFIPLLFAVLLQNNGVSVDLAYPWGKWHMGDYDLEKVFDEVDSMEAYK
ncbi:MAG: alpha/beta hydrolase [Lachnospiraceae bacterium]|nr:alpha/beta hydrolase [Lachnospiraceae bacterium]